MSFCNKIDNANQKNMHYEKNIHHYCFDNKYFMF